jgi:cyclopropane-fatty-acyl-phospholipid synthase
MLVEFLKNNIKYGRLLLTLPDGTRHQFGNDNEPEAHWRFNNKTVITRILRDPDMELGETYMEGGWDAGEPGLRRLFEIFMRNFREGQAKGWTRRIQEALHKLIAQSNRILQSYRHIEYHYDKDEWLFRQFLDQGLFYSCAYFEHPELSLEDAQQAKCRLIMRKLLLKPGQRVLDIGSGWGGLAFYLAAHAEVEVVGITLSQEQLRVAQHEAQDRGLGDRVNFLLQDYREHKGEYDRIVSVGMFEHVGLQNYRAFFEQVRHLLKSDGVALLHTIGVSGKAGLNNVWIRRHIFPGSYLSTLSQITPAIEKTGLMITDIEVLRLHYAHTLAEWYRRFQSHRLEAVERLGERFARMWEFYLASCEASFRFWDLVVFQVQMARQHGAVPITRDYLVRREG